MKGVKISDILFKEFYTFGSLVIKRFNVSDFVVLKLQGGV